MSCNLEKRLRKIEKSEDKAIKILNKRKKDLLKAIEENDKLIEQRLNKGTPAELKIEQEIEKITKRLEDLRRDQDRIRTKREELATPLRERGEELREKLQLVETQLSASMTSKEKRSLSRMDLNEVTKDSWSDVPTDEDLTPSSPPPYSPYYPAGE